MADKKISALTSASTPLAGTEVLPIVQSGATVKVAAASLTSGSWQQAFSAYLGTSQTVPLATISKILIDTEEFDIGNCFDTGTSRFQPTVAGYYQVTGEVTVFTGTGVLYPAIFKNGSNAKGGNTTTINAINCTANVTALIYMNGTTDYLELYVYQTAAVSHTVAAGASYTYFQAAYIRG
jgi:hypothetical protein